MDAASSAIVRKGLGGARKRSGKLGISIVSGMPCACMRGSSAAAYTLDAARATRRKGDAGLWSAVRRRVWQEGEGGYWRSTHLRASKASAHEHDAHGVLELLQAQATAQLKARLERVAMIPDPLIILQKHQLGVELLLLLRHLTPHSACRAGRHVRDRWARSRQKAGRRALCGAAGEGR